MLIKTVKTNTPTRPDFLESCFRPVSGTSGSVWLDSSRSIGNSGRCSLIARNPSLDVSLTDEGIVIRRRDNNHAVIKNGDVFQILNKLWHEEGLFSVGYISYEATLPSLGVKPHSGTASIPLVRFLFYDSVLEYDHLTNQISVSDPGRDDYGDMFRSADSTTAMSIPTPGHIRIIDSKSEYLLKVERIKAHIREGDIYQANYTTRIEVDSGIDPFDAYCRLRRLNPAPYAAFMNLGDYQILSSSPERMFTKSERTIKTSPIKGTIAVGSDTLETERNLQKLLHSEKDRAELLMIVDLERNDLGKIARCGTVTVENLFRPEVHSSVIHLVSDVSAELRESVSMEEIIKALLPGGSITGAPKKRAAEIIADLEVVPRQVYTGSIGYVRNQRADFNLAIRTVLHQSGAYHVNAGGGIVADSDPEDEYHEMLLKAKNMLRAVGVDNLEGIQ